MSQNAEPVEKEMKELAASYQADKLEFIKNPVIAEFLGLSSNTDFTESELEQRIITHIQKFLMELGKWYAFVARQQHIRTEKEDYYIDLVFYNYILKCFVLIDLKTSKITHQDVGQATLSREGIDHGYGKMKTAIRCFPSGVARYDKEPIFQNNLLVYNGIYYQIGEEHKEFCAEKTRDEDGAMVITQNPTLAPAVQKSKYEPKADISVSSDIVKDATAFLETFFKLYPTATEIEEQKRFKQY